MSATLTWSIILQRLVSWLAKKEYARAKKREESRKKLPVKLSIILFALLSFSGCATYDRAYIFGYELIHGKPQQEQPSCGTK